MLAASLGKTRILSRGYFGGGVVEFSAHYKNRRVVTFVGKYPNEDHTKPEEDTSEP